MSAIELFCLQKINNIIIDIKIENHIKFCIFSNELEIRVLDLISQDARRTRIVKCYLVSRWIDRQIIC